MSATDRRRTGLTVHDLRIYLREADEERYQLTLRSGDWRQPRVGVQELRRQLREADEERFHLTNRVGRLGAMVKRGGAAAVLVMIAGAAFAAWTPQGARAVSPDLAAESIDAPSAVIHAALPGDTEQTAIPDPLRAGPSIGSEAPDGRPASVEGLVPPVQPAQRRATTVRVHTGPRPLHPGEFGRKTLRR